MKKSEIREMSALEVNQKYLIEGTKFDRKVKITPTVVSKMKAMKDNGATYTKIAKKYGVSVTAVRYHLNDTYRDSVCHRGGSHSRGYITDTMRGEYKRELLLRGCKLATND